ncbi:hypothetical protein [Salipiger bermudensis]|uniref:hypothetical protein n=1 Tax=Salipiger bermudensis TaxID=344736 RepID=UPI001CD55538|nr:hypothetical protein [Salipiger bermudensis]MCA0963857.1 hypothetical protein [Salipiger bermudensis]
MKNPLLFRLHELQASEIYNHIPELVSGSNVPALTFRKYVSSRPERFYSQAAFSALHEALLDIENNYAKELRLYVANRSEEIDNAFLHAKEINAQEWHDREVKAGDDYRSLILIDRDMHPAYLRLVEAVFQPLLHLVAYFSRLSSGKGTDGLNLYNIVAELPDEPFAKVKLSYVHLMRNGIAHGGVKYSSNEIIYRDSKGKEATFKSYDVVRKFDDFLDTCNGLLLAYSVFALTRLGNEGLVPQNLMVEEIRAESQTPYWEVNGILPSTILGGKSQLIVYCDAKTMDEDKIRFSTFQTAVLAEGAAPGFDRYFISMRGPNGLPGMASFHGNELAAHRLKEHSIEQYTDVIQDYLPMFAATRRMFRWQKKVNTLKFVLAVGWPVALADYRSHTGRPQMIVRSASIHRNGWGAVLNADVVIESDNAPVNQDIVRRYSRTIIRQARKIARREQSWFSVVKYLPLGFAQMNVFCKDYRARRLSGFGLGEDLVGTIRLQRIRRIKSPDISGSTIELRRGLRFAWNRNWLERE